METSKQANAFLNQWCEKDQKNKNLYKFIIKNQLATHGMKVGA